MHTIANFGIIFPNLLGDIFSKNELEQFESKDTDLTSSNYRDIYVVRTNQFSTEEDDYKTVLLDKNLVDECLEERREEMMDNNSILDGVKYNAQCEYFYLDQKDSIGSQGNIRINSEEPITQESLNQRYNKIQSFFQNDYKDFVADVEEYNNKIDAYNKTVDESQQKPHRYVSDRVIIDGKEQTISDEEYQRHYDIYLATRNGGKVSDNIMANFYYQEFMNTPNEERYKNAPQFESMVEKWTNQGDEMWDVYRKASIAVNTGLVPQGDETLFSHFIDDNYASYTMKDVNNDNLKEAMLNSISSLDDIKHMNAMANVLMDILGTTPNQNTFQTQLNEYAKTTQNNDTMHNYKFTGDISIDDNSSEEYKNFITNNLINFFEAKKSNYSGQEEQDVCQSLVDSLKDTLDSDVEENNSILYQYTRNI